MNLKSIHQNNDASIDAFESYDRNSDIYRVPTELMMAIPSISIDYAVMEHSSCVKVVPCETGWSDLGSFDAIYERAQSAEQNVVLKDSITLNSSNPEPWIKNSQERSPVIQSSRKVVLLGVSNLLVVDTPDALMISDRGRSQQVSENSQAT